MRLDRAAAQQPTEMALDRTATRRRRTGGLVKQAVRDEEVGYLK